MNDFMIFFYNNYLKYLQMLLFEPDKFLAEIYMIIMMFRGLINDKTSM